MSFLDALILGIIQGLSEFLPISSTGHLTVAGKVMNLISESNPEHWTAFIAVIQLGTLIAVIIYFWNDLINIIKDFLNDNIRVRKKYSEQSGNSKMGWYLVFATVPVVIIGLSLKKIIEGVLTKNLFVIASSLILLAIILAIAERIGKFTRNSSDFKWYDAVLIGFAQAVALIPGSSRSGTTITAGLFLGFKRETAARFSFLMSIPAVALSGLFEFYQALKYLDSQGTVLLLTGTVVSAITGYVTIDFLLRFLRTNSTLVFIIYRILIGILILFFIGTGIISP